MFYQTEAWTCPLCGHEAESIKQEANGLLILCPSCRCRILYRRGEVVGHFAPDPIAMFVERISHAA